MLAETMLQDTRLSRDYRKIVCDHRPAFLFGNTAPDVQTISGQERAATHFFTIPVRDSTNPQERMFELYCCLEQSDQLAADHVAFIAGYITHLLIDQLWIKQVFQPCFSVTKNHQEMQRHLFLHNVLRVYLDRSERKQLPEDIADVISQTQPRSWLPFVDDHHLCQWRDFLAGQLCTKGTPLTVDVFAARMNIRPDEFKIALGSRKLLEGEIFSRISKNNLSKFRSRALKQSINALSGYLSRRSR
jgi:hypothetical protein